MIQVNNHTISSAMKLEGQTSKPALFLMAAFIGKMQDLGVETGAIVEFGTFRGRVSSLLGMTMRHGDELHLVDVTDYLEHAELKQRGIEYSFHLSRSEEWSPGVANAKHFVFSHHDASHYFSNVTSELKMIDQVLHPKGVVVLDDFTDPYNQVRAAYYYCRYVLNLDLELLLMGFGKAILVRRGSFALYEEFVLKGLQPSLTNVDFPTTLFRTDNNEHARAFSIAKKLTPDSPDLYGLNVWGDRFYQPSK